MNLPLVALAIAAVVAPGERPLPLPNVVVIGEERASPGTPVIDPDAAERSPAADGADALRDVLGISLGRFGGRGLEPVIRGQGMNRLNVLLDGAYIHGGCPNRMDPPASFSALESYDRITVLKGVQTVTLGGGGSGGTVLFERITEPAPGSSGRIRAGASTNGIDYHASGDVQVGTEHTYLRFIGEVREAGDYTDGNGDRVRSSYRHQAGNVVLGWADDGQQVEANLERTDTDDSLYPGAGMDAPLEESENVRLRYVLEPAADGFDELSVQLYRTDVEHLMDNYSLRPLTAPVAARVPARSLTSGGRLEVKGRLGTVAWTAGLDHQGNERDSSRFVGPDPGNVDRLQSRMWPGAKLDQTGFYGEALWPLAGGEMTAGLRFDRVRAEATGVGEQPAAPFLSPNELYDRYYGVEAKEVRENNLGGLLRYEASLDEDLRLFAGLSRTLRTADATERYLAANGASPTMRWVGNPGLEPERHHQFDLGFAWATGDAVLDGVVYLDQVGDYVLRDRARDQAGVLRADRATIYRNVDARLLGAEFEWRQALTRALELTANVAWVRAENRDEDRPIAQTPPLNGLIKLDYERADWKLGGRVRWADRQDRVDADPITGSGLDARATPGYAVLDVFANYSFGPGVTLRAGVDNLLDRAYAEHLNRRNLDPFNPEALQVNEPGRTAWVDLRVFF